MKNDYLIQKKPLAALAIFSAPMIIGNLFQQFYTMVDSAILGRFVSEQALAAVGASYSFTNIFICVAIGGGVGASVIVSRYFGAKQYAKMKTALYTSLIAFLFFSCALGALGLWCGRAIMKALRTPEDVLDLSMEYLNIYFWGLPFLFMYNVLSSMFNALGKSRIPLYFLIFSSLLNVFLDYDLVTRYGMGVAGVAWATLIAQGLSAALSLIVLLLMLGRMVPERGKAFERRELLPMARISLPSILQQSTVSIGMMLVQSVVNSFGSQALAGFSAAMRVESVCVVPMSAIGNAMSSYTAQNLGAKKEHRVVEGYHAANLLVVIFALIICVVVEGFNAQIVEMFLGENGSETAIQTGRAYLSFMGWFFCLIGFKMALDGILRGSGDMRPFTFATLANLTIRVLVAKLLSPVYGIQMVWIAVPIGWATNFTISYIAYRRGGWKKGAM